MSEVHSREHKPEIVTGNTAETRPENRAFYPALDGLRWLALSAVVLVHYASVPWGWTGVDLFFVLSGFLITGILFDSRDDEHRVYNFYIRRTLRIFPLYYAMLLLPLLTRPFFHWDYTRQFWIWPVYLGNFGRFMDLPGRVGNFQVHGMYHRHHLTLFFGHFWSLCVEEQFYLLWPWVVFWLRDRRVLLRICLASVPVCLALRLLGEHSLRQSLVDAEVLYRATPFRLDALLLGGALALLLRGPRAAEILKYSSWLLAAMLVGIVAWMAVAFSTHVWMTGFVNPAWKFTWGLTLVDVLYAVLILQALVPGTQIYRIFALRPLRWMGRITYGAYVFHDVIHIPLSDIARTLVPVRVGTLTTIFAFFFAFGMAWLSFRYFESPILAWKERLTRGGISKSPA